jgi:hypothetical protein
MIAWWRSSTADAARIDEDVTMPDLPTLQRKLKDVRQEIRNLQVMQMRPGQSAQELKVLSDLERSARAEVKLRVKALEHARKNPMPPAERLSGNGRKPTSAPPHPWVGQDCSRQPVEVSSNTSEKRVGGRAF